MTLQTLHYSTAIRVNVLVTSCLFYCNAPLYYLPNKLLHRPQLVHNSAVHIISIHHITPVLKQLY